MAAAVDRFDALFLNVAENAGSIENILDAFFGFLQRKTDFFSGNTDPKKPEELVLTSFKKHFKEGQKKREAEIKRNLEIDKERKVKEEEKKKKDLEEYEERERQRKAAKIEEVSEDTPLGVQRSDDKEEEVVGEKKDETKKADKDKKDDDDGAEAKEEEDNTPPPLGNGGTTDKYTWTQTLNALEVAIPVRPGTKAKDIICKIGVDTLKLGVKGDEMILDGKVHSKLKPDDCTWALIDNKTVQISLEKFDEMKWWACVMVGDPEIDCKKICPENSKLSDLDGETRTTVEKMMYDQRAKAAGKPTSDQKGQFEMLEKFKQQHPEMDFSNCKINYGGGNQGGFNFPTNE